jgi:CRP-like cAMP-binding protein
MRGAPIDVLKRVPIFADLADGELGQIASLFKERRFAAGDIVVQEGSGGAAFFVIRSGEAKVFLGSNEHTTLKAGDYFGEIALLHDVARTAACVQNDRRVCPSALPSFITSPP